MQLRENPKRNPIHYPSDRRHRVWVRPRILFGFLAVIILPVLVAWLQYLISGEPTIPPLPTKPSLAGFPAWIRLAHYANLVFMVLLIRSGISILMDHPRLYWNTHSTPGSQWARFTPIAVPQDRTWTAKDDARYISPWLALPGYRHSIGVARHWHFPFALFFLTNGVLFVLLAFVTAHWQRLVPSSGAIFANAWAYFVHYATARMPPEPNGFYGYNGLQQLAYFGVVFIMAPLSFLTGLAMSPAIDNHFRWYVKLFGNRQAARSVHFLLLIGYLVFIALHVLMVCLTGLTRNMNHIVLGTDTNNPLGLALGFVGIVALVAICVIAHWHSWSSPRALQYGSKRLIEPLMRLYFNPLIPAAEYTKRDISPHFWPNGKMPSDEKWQKLAEGAFRDYRLRVFGLIEKPVELSLQELMSLGKKKQITLHHCIQGWSGIAEWGGLPMSRLVELVRPLPEATVVVFRSFGEGLYGGRYYDTQLMENVHHPQTILAYEMNGKPLEPLYGAPLRLRVENQLGYKMVKWIESIEFVVSEKQIGKGFGGKNEDDEYFDLIPNI